MPDVARDADAARLPRSARRREPGVVVTRARVPARHRRRVRRGRLAGLLAAACATTASTVVDGWEQAYNEEFSARRRRRRPPARRVVRVEPAGRGRIYADPRPKRAPTAALLATCFRQVEFAGILDGTAQPSTPPAGSSTSCCRGRSRRTCRSRCSCTRCVRGRGSCRRCSRSSRRSPSDPLVAARRRRSPRTATLDRRVDRHRAAMSIRRGARARPCSWSPVVFLGVFFVYPVPRSSGAGSRPTEASTLGPWRTCSRDARPPGGAVVHGLAGRAVDRASPSSSRCRART